MKSKLTFAKRHIRVTVEEMIKKDPGYLVGCYYKMHGISFTDDVLAALHITRKIPKPGVDFAIHEEMRLSGDVKKRQRSVYMNQKAADYDIQVKDSATTRTKGRSYSKSYLMRKNHGK